MTARRTHDGGWPVDDVVARLRAPGGYDAFADQVRRARCCQRPVRLIGQVTATGADGRRTVVFDSRRLPDGVLLKACGTRRETLCRPCAAIYRGDAFHLAAAGLRGGKGIPDTIAEHPAVLVTLTAPSFGAVHRQRPDGTCHPAGRRCRHGRLLVCPRHHHTDDPDLGQPLCPHCYDYTAAVLFNATVSELWRRTAIYALRALAALIGRTVRQANRTLRLSYVKVVEFQRRGAVHVHALVRVDWRGDEHGQPPDEVDAATLASAMRIAAAKVTCPNPKSGQARLRWGTQTDIAVLTDQPLIRRRAAAYTAKYATKGTDPHGVLDRRLRTGVPPTLELPDHLRRLVTTAWTLADHPELAHLRLRLWAHTCGHRGHFLTKTRLYSTTFATLRHERHRWATTQTDDDGDARDGPHGRSMQAHEGEGDWRFTGTGYKNPGDTWIAHSLATTHRHNRQNAHDQRRRDTANRLERHEPKDETCP